MKLRRPPASTSRAPEAARAGLRRRAPFFLSSGLTRSLHVLDGGTLSLWCAIGHEESPGPRRGRRGGRPGAGSGMILSPGSGRRFRKCHVGCGCIRCARVSRGQTTTIRELPHGVPSPCPAGAENLPLTRELSCDIDGIPADSTCNARSSRPKMSARFVREGRTKCVYAIG